MTSRRGGREGYKSPPSPPSSGSEDNGFTNRPRVAGLYVKNLSREELDELSKEGIYGPTGNPNDRPRDSGSQRSLNLPGSSRDADGQDRARGVASRTPQPPRRSGVGARYREAGLSEHLTRRDHHGSLPLERSWSRQLEDRSDRASPERYVRGSSEFPPAWREPLARPGTGVSPGGSSADVRTTAEESRIATGSRRFGEVSKRPDKPPPPPRVPSSLGTTGRDQGTSSLSVGQSPPPHASPSSVDDPPASRISPRDATRHYRADGESPYERPGSPLSRENEDSDTSKQMSDSSKVEEAPDPSRAPATEEPVSPESKKSGTPSPTKRTGIRVQDSTRLRPPLAVTAGTSADSGTGDSGSAEIQADVMTPQTASNDILDDGLSKLEGRSPGSRTPGSKGGKQTVKPFTKESLERLENKTVQLVREYGFQPKRKMSVEDGAVLPNKFEPFPNNLYGRPLEEIDNFIYDEVSSKTRFSRFLLPPSFRSDKVIQTHNDITITDARLSEAQMKSVTYVYPRPETNRLRIFFPYHDVETNFSLDYNVVIEVWGNFCEIGAPITFQSTPADNSSRTCFKFVSLIRMRKEVNVKRSCHPQRYNARRHNTISAVVYSGLYRRALPTGT